MYEEILPSLEAFIQGLAPLESTILDERLLSQSPRTLEDIGSTHNLTRERVRQKQTDLKRKVVNLIDPACLHGAEELAPRLGEIEKISRVKTYIDQAVPNADHRALSLLIDRTLDHLGYSRSGRNLVSNRAQALVRDLKTNAKELADSCGLIHPSAFAGLFEDDDLAQHADWFVTKSGLHRVFHMIALRVTRRAKLRAALLYLNRPASRPELAHMCSLSDKVTSASLSSMPEIVRVTSSAWGLREWNHHEYRGIVKEIEAYIEERDGVADVDLLIDQLSTRFDVKDSSVRAFLQTPRFNLSDGWATVADPAMEPLKPIEAVIDGFDSRDLMFWTFPVMERYFRGYSIVGIPYEIANFLGCEPESSTKLRIRNLPQMPRFDVAVVHVFDYESVDWVYS